NSDRRAVARIHARRRAGAAGGARDAAVRDQPRGHAAGLDRPRRGEPLARAGAPARDAVELGRARSLTGQRGLGESYARRDRPIQSFRWTRIRFTFRNFWEAFAQKPMRIAWPPMRN